MTSFNNNFENTTLDNLEYQGIPLPRNVDVNKQYATHFIRVPGHEDLLFRFRGGEEAWSEITYLEANTELNSLEQEFGVTIIPRQLVIYNLYFNEFNPTALEKTVIPQKTAGWLIPNMNSISINEFLTTDIDGLTLEEKVTMADNFLYKLLNYTYTRLSTNKPFLWDISLYQSSFDLKNRRLFLHDIDPFITDKAQGTFTKDMEGLLALVNYDIRQLKQILATNNTKVVLQSEFKVEDILNFLQW